MPNAWISHARNYAKENNIKYSDALKDPGCSASYKTGGGPVHANKVGPTPPAPPAMNENPLLGLVEVPHMWRDNHRDRRIMSETEANKHIGRNTKNYKHFNIGRGVGGLNKVMANRSMERGLIHHGMRPQVIQPIANMTRYGVPGTFTHEDARRIDQEDRERRERRDRAKVTPVTY